MSISAKTENHTPEFSKTESGNPLRRDLGSFAGYATIMGTMIGSGLFVVTGIGGDTAGPAASIAYLILLPILLSTTMACFLES